MRRVFWILGFAAIVFGLSVLAFLFFCGETLISSQNRVVGSAPKDFPVEAVSFDSRSGTMIHGWWRPSVSSFTEVKGTVLLLHAIRSDRRAMVGRARFLSEAGFQCLLIDLQAHGESLGDHISLGHLESLDVAAALAFISGRSPSLPIAIIGSSLGGGSAILCQSDVDVSAIIIEGVFSSLEKATENRLNMRLGSVGNIFAPLLYCQVPFRLGCGLDDLRPVDRIHEIDRPILIMNGSDDHRATQFEAKTLFARTKSPKQLWIVDGAGHVDLHEFAGLEYEEKVLSFLSDHLE